MIWKQQLVRIKLNFCWTPSDVTNGDNNLSANSLNFFYDNNRTSWTEKSCTCYDMNTGENTPDWNTHASDCVSIYIDSTFKNFQPTTCCYWFGQFNNENLTTIDCSNIDTSQVTNMAYMFNYCNNLTNLNVSNFDTSNVTDMSCMFEGCSKLISLNISNFDINNVTMMEYMFEFSNNLITIYCNNDWSASSAYSTYMFYDCIKLPHFDDSKTDKTYAYPNNGSTGYFTSKTENTLKSTNIKINTIDTPLIMTTSTNNTQKVEDTVINNLTSDSDYYRLLKSAGIVKNLTISLDQSVIDVYLDNLRDFERFIVKNDKSVSKDNSEKDSKDTSKKTNTDNKNESNSADMTTYCRVNKDGNVSPLDEGLVGDTRAIKLDVVLDRLTKFT